MGDFARRARRAAEPMARPMRRLIGPALEPEFLVIGAQKSGTTALFTHLARHPSIAAPVTKEIDFFGCPARFARGLDFYHSHFPRRRLARGCTVTFEASPHYLVDSAAADRIHGYRPRMQLIVLLRDPVARAFSAWQMYRRLARRNPDWHTRWARRCDPTAPTPARRPTSFGRDFTDDVRAELRARADGVPVEMPLLDHGLYADQLGAYIERFGRDRLWVERAEDYRDDPAATLGRVVEFLGLSSHRWDHEILQEEFAGSYHDPVPTDAARLLNEFYGASTAAVEVMLDRPTGWLRS